MHGVLHVAILATTVMGVAGLALLVLWPLIFEAPPTHATRALVLVAVGVAGLLFLVEWRLVH